MISTVIRINDTEYMMVFNNWVMVQLEQQHISLSALSESEHPVGDIARMMVAMINGGSRYAQRFGLGDYPGITLDDFLELTDLADFSAYQAMMGELIAGERQVDAAPPKKPAGDTEAAQPN